jgi:Undecaprenyl-phosphate galactose phosphotransferase WbaP
MTVMMVDILILSAVFYLFSSLDLRNQLNFHDGWTHGSLVAIPLLLCTWFAAKGHYTDRIGFSAEAAHIAVGTSVAFLVACSLALGRSESLPFAAMPWVVATLLVVGGRLSFKRMMFRMGFWQLHTAVIGSELRVGAICAALKNDWYRGYSANCIFPAQEISNAVIGPKLGQMMANGSIRHVLIAPDGEDCEAASVILRAIRLQYGLTSSIVPPFMGLPAGRLAVETYFGHDGVVLREAGAIAFIHHIWIKRLFDVIVGSLLLVTVAPIMLLIAMAVRLDGGPALYGSLRIGRGGALFAALKFRTMVQDADRVLRDLLEHDPEARREWEAGFKLRRDPRITRIGRFLRETSLDEIPQLLNVVRGEMSLVGPRPMLPAERPIYGEAFATYCQCIPGITGPWQVSGRNALEYSRRIELNNWYANNASFWVDMAILVRTIGVVVRRKGAA